MRPLDAPRINPSVSSNSRQESLLSLALPRKCGICPKLFKYRTSSDICSECRAKLTTNLRTTTLRIREYLKPVSRAVFPEADDPLIIMEVEQYLDFLPKAKTARHQKLSQDLYVLDESIYRNGLFEYAHRQYIRKRATVIALALLALNIKSDRRYIIHAREILGDAGFESPVTPQKISQILGHIKAAVRFYEKEKDYCNLGRALMTWGNIQRTFKDEAAAAPRFTWAFNVLEALAETSNDKAVIWYFHRAINWSLKCFGGERTREEQESKILKLKEFAGKIQGDERLLIEHYRDEAGHWCSFNKRDRAEQSLEALDKLREKLSSGPYPLYYEPPLLRARIEFLFENETEQDKEKAIEEWIKQKYFCGYLRNPEFYYHRQLKRWTGKLGFTLAARLPAPEYFNTFFVPRAL